MTVRDVVRAPRGWRVETGADERRAQHRRRRRDPRGARTCRGAAGEGAVGPGRGRAVRDRRHLCRRRHAPLPPKRPARAATCPRAAATSCRRRPAPGEGGDVLLAQVAVGRRRRAHRAASSPCAARWAMADDVEMLQRDDDELARLAADDLAFAARLGRARPIASRVTRWGGGLPRYAVGHVDRAERIVAALQSLPGMAMCGAAFDGVGIAACIGRADKAATHISQGLGSRRRMASWLTQARWRTGPARASGRSRARSRRRSTSRSATRPGRSSGPPTPMGDADRAALVARGRGSSSSSSPPRTSWCAASTT